MTQYPHFAFPKLFLLNGYKELETHRGIELEYEQEDDLEQCIRRLLVRKPTRFQGWDLRFLRRGLGLSQADVGAQIDRDAQTIARWEKSADPIPSAVDLAIRTRFAARFEPQLSTQEILDYVDGRGERLPTSIYFRLTNDGWQFEAQPKVKFARSKAYGDARVLVGANVGLVYRFSNHFVRENSARLVIASKLPDIIGTIQGDKIFVMEAKLPEAVAETIVNEPSQAKTRQLKVDIKGSAHEYASATIH